MLSISRAGTPEIERGLVRAEPSQQASNDNSPQEKKARPSLPSSLVRELTAHRTAALRAVLADQPEVALDAVVYTLALPVLYPHSTVKGCLDISVEQRPLGKDASGIEESPATERTDRQRFAWSQILPDADAFWDWLCEQPQETKLQLLAFCAAQSLSAVRLKADLPATAADLHADAIHTAIGLNMAQWWQPTRRTYLGQVSRNHILTAVREACGLQTSSTFGREKREAMLARAERKLAGTGWLPVLLRSPVAPANAETADAEILEAA